MADANSDVDIGLYYGPDRSIDLRALRAAAVDLGGVAAAEAVTGIGEWGPWINGGAWLEIDGGSIDWLYRDLDRVRGAIEHASAESITFDYQPGHPHGFANRLYMAEIALGLPLWDPRGVLEELRRATQPYPRALRSAIVDAFGWEAVFSLDIAINPAARGDAVYVAGCLYRAVACLLQVLFATNEHYLVNEKGAMAAAAAFELKPRGFETLAATIAAPGASSAELRSSLESVRTVVEQSLELAGAST